MVAAAGESRAQRVLPPGVEEALISARQKYDAGKPLGYDISEMIRAAHEARRKAAATDKKTP